MRKPSPPSRAQAATVDLCKKAARFKTGPKAPRRAPVRCDDGCEAAEALERQEADAAAERMLQEQEGRRGRPDLLGERSSDTQHAAGLHGIHALKILLDFGSVSWLLLPPSCGVRGEQGMGYASRVSTLLVIGVKPFPYETLDGTSHLAALHDSM
ncbi:hypothetical protein cyc_04410 [Cyclospora cayetanensis]|uniref:Uncharacterized protein n=1 Tax=Cyclospora cayetanensis TaxID=88456 RepID=A0A1D3CY95_9EIME|nr:hypothetical protein cyc_04410 [Cyclospora cayetanensis]